MRRPSYVMTVVGGAVSIALMVGVLGFNGSAFAAGRQDLPPYSEGVIKNWPTTLPPAGTSTSPNGRKDQVAGDIEGDDGGGKGDGGGDGGEQIYLKPYRLRAVGKHIEVWVAASGQPPEPREGCTVALPGTAAITDAQLDSLVSEFDGNIYPKEAAAFSTLPVRDGTKSTIPGDFRGTGKNLVLLIDDNTGSKGFYSQDYADAVDRNLITLDGEDWEHRFGASPPDDPTDDLCTSRPALAHRYEMALAHEYQHALIRQFKPEGEETLINEGLSHYAMTVTGYGHAKATVFDQDTAQGPDIPCFQGFGTVATPYHRDTTACGGPENSLTNWYDEGLETVSADYGNAWSFMLYLADHYGPDFMRALHRDGSQIGLALIQKQLDRYGHGAKVQDVIHDYQVMNLVDGIVGDNGVVVGADRSKVTTPSLDAQLNLDNPASYEKVGVSPNGADYVRLRDAKGAALTGSQLVSVSFSAPASPSTKPLTVRLVGIDKAKHRVRVLPVTSHRLDKKGSGQSAVLRVKKLGVLAGFPEVVAVVSYDEPTGEDFTNASYSLSVNDVVQPGGGTVPEDD